MDSTAILTQLKNWKLGGQSKETNNTLIMLLFICIYLFVHIYFLCIYKIYVYISMCVYIYVYMVVVKEIGKDMWQILTSWGLGKRM